MRKARVCNLRHPEADRDPLSPNSLRAGLELKAMLKRKSDPWDREVEFQREA